MASTSRRSGILVDADLRRPSVAEFMGLAGEVGLTGGALVVVGADRLHRQQLADGLGSLETVGARVLGVVLNRFSHKQADSYSYYDYAYASGTGTKSKRKRRRKHAATSDPTPQDPARTRSGPSPSASEESEAGVSIDSTSGSSPAPTHTARSSEDPVSGAGNARH